MAFTVRSKVTISGDSQMYSRTGARLRDRGVLHRRVGVLMMSSALGRLSSVLRQGDGVVRSGRLAKSIAEGVQGQSGGNTIFRLTRNSVEVGTNLPYAAQVHFGGTIRPKKGKALAIPLVARLQRQQLSPRDFADDELSFVPAKKKGGIIGFLVGQSPGGRKRKTSLRQSALFMLVAKVTQRPRPYLFFDDSDRREIDHLTLDYMEAA